MEGFHWVHAHFEGNFGILFPYSADEDEPVNALGIVSFQNADDPLEIQARAVSPPKVQPAAVSMEAGDGARIIVSKDGLV